MSSPKKLAIAGLSATALVASIGFAFAQSTDDTALANSNYNGAQNSAENNVNGPPAMPSSAVTAYDAETGAAATMAGQPTTTSSDYSSSSSSSSMAPTDSAATAPSSTSPWSADSSQSTSTTTSTTSTTTDASGANPTAGTSPDKIDISHPAVAPQGAQGAQGDTIRTETGTNSSVTTNTTTAPPAPPAAAPVQTETRVDLNSPNEPQYNLASDPWLRHGQAKNSNNAPADNSTSGTPSSGERAPRADRN